jgi:DNA-binding NtrC family response regulator
MNVLDLPSLPLSPAERRVIVVIDSSVTMRVLLACTLQRLGFAVARYASARQALEDLRRLSLPPILVLVRERTCGALSGWKVLQYLHAWEDLPLRVVLLLDHDCASSRMKASLAGACACLAMPFAIQQLIRLVQVYGRV